MVKPCLLLATEALVVQQALAAGQGGHSFVSKTCKDFVFGLRALACCESNEMF